MDNKEFIADSNSYGLTLCIDPDSDKIYDHDYTFLSNFQILYKIKFGETFYVILERHLILSSYLDKNLRKHDMNDVFEVILKTSKDSKAFDIVMKLIYGYHKVKITKEKFLPCLKIIEELDIKDKDFRNSLNQIIMKENLILKSTSNNFLNSNINESKNDSLLFEKLRKFKIDKEILTMHENLVKKVLILENCKKIITSSFDHSIKIWDVETGNAIATLGGHEDGVYNIIILSDGRLASCGFDETIKIWNIATDSYQCVQTLIGHTDCINSLVELPDSILVSGSMAQTLRLWDLKQTTKQITSFKTIQCSKQNIVNSLVLITSYEIAVSSFSHINIYDINQKNYNFTLSKILCGHTTYVRDIKVLCSTKRILVSGSADHALKLWDINSGKCLRTLIGHNSWVFNILVLSDDIFVSASTEIKFWKASTGECIETIDEGNGLPIFTLAQLNKDSIVFSGEKPNLKIVRY